MPHEMETPAKRLEAYLKGLFQEFKKTPLPIPAGIALSAAAYGLVLLYAGTFCLSGLVTPLFMLGILWLFGIKGIKRLLVIGVISCLAFAGVWLVISTDHYQHLVSKDATSEKGVLLDGRVSPLYGNSTTRFNYTLTVHTDANATVERVRLIRGGVEFPSSAAEEHLMLLAWRDNATNNSYYYYNTTASKPVNWFYFSVNVSGTEYLADERNSDGTESVTYKPIYVDTSAVAISLVPPSFVSPFIGVFPMYALLLLMIWWTRRARKMRVQAYERAVEVRAKEKEGIPQEKAKVPSLAEAMGKEASGEGFVCSECGADVPAEAKRCPKCGERFD